jgi:hypothetical protein
MHVDPTRQKEIAEAEAKVARLENHAFTASMSNNRYHSSGRAAKDKAELAEARRNLEELKKDQ